MSRIWKNWKFILKYIITYINIFTIIKQKYKLKISEIIYLNILASYKRNNKECY